MKDEHDNSTGELLDGTASCPAGAGCRSAVNAKKANPKFERLPGQDNFMPPEGAKFFGFGQSFVPVSSVARDMGISARRVRVMLAEGRLSGRQRRNGYWEVFYPYRYVLGTRGPTLKRQQRLPGKPKNPELMQERQP